MHEKDCFLEKLIKTVLGELKCYIKASWFYRLRFLYLNHHFIIYFSVNPVLISTFYSYSYIQFTFSEIREIDEIRHENR